TPTEVLQALDTGAELIKIFPAETGGPRHIQAILAPLPQARLLPTGGVTPENVGEWLKAGAAAVGIGAALVGPGREPVNAANLKARAAILTESLAAR
ncbi:MAG TPA: bifunctional 2-keto-4-hydroxyglutarate aldolase/2-keto-3-deoxy-6-phosphogluconate aldolase, partial [bacterium]|nr:bifunctional 2-keto-4-hydroxyglutarate aldolase/2-keto-3-deoxy-6-phosphogluconate aldolase [bacterium]